MPPKLLLSLRSKFENSHQGTPHTSTSHLSLVTCPFMERMMNDEKKTGRAEARKSRRAENAKEKRRRREEQKSGKKLNLWTSVFYSWKFE